MKGLLCLCAVAVLLSTSCEKADTPVPLPEKGEAGYDQLDLGEEYKLQVFYDFETGAVIHTSEPNSWHLAFETAPGGFHIFQNGVTSVRVYNTHQTDFAKVNRTMVPGDSSLEWRMDASCGVPDSTGIGDWRAANTVSSLSKNEVYILEYNATYDKDNVKKFRVVAVNDKEYTIEYCSIDEIVPTTATILKDDTYNYSYFSFYNGGQSLQLEPPKDSWDIVFTRYRIIYYNLGNQPYTVTGVLLNPYNTVAARTKAKSFSDVDNSLLPEVALINHRDVIGYDWKIFDFQKYLYSIDKETTFIIKNRKDHYWKMHFIDFYNKQGIKGSPSFEFQRFN